MRLEGGVEGCKAESGVFTVESQVSTDTDRSAIQDYSKVVKRWINPRN